MSIGPPTKGDFLKGEMNDEKTGMHYPPEQTGRG